jgi:hypothetical protein
MVLALSMGPGNVSSESARLFAHSLTEEWMLGNRKRTIVTLACVVAGCAYSSSFQRAPGAPVLPPSPAAEVLTTPPPPDAVLLGTVSAQGNNLQSSGTCEAELVTEARKLGANAVLTTPASSSLGRGPKCEGKAYLLKTK